MRVTAADLRGRIRRLPHIRLAALPTPLDECPQLSEAAGAEPPDWIYLSSGSGGSATLAGTWLGCAALGWPTRVVGVCAAPPPKSVHEDTLDIARRALRLVGLDVGLADRSDAMILEGGFVGDGYGIATREGLEAMRLAARTEGLVLDPWYTGKALAALLGHIRLERVAPCDSVVFVHTGGVPLIFLRDLGQQIAGES